MNHDLMKILRPLISPRRTCRLWPHLDQGRLLIGSKPILTYTLEGYYAGPAPGFQWASQTLHPVGRYGTRLRTPGIAQSIVTSDHTEDGKPHLDQGRLLISTLILTLTAGRLLLHRPQQRLFQDTLLYHLHSYADQPAEYLESPCRNGPNEGQPSGLSSPRVAAYPCKGPHSPILFPLEEQRLCQRLRGLLLLPARAVRQRCQAPGLPERSGTRTTDT